MAKIISFLVLSGSLTLGACSTITVPNIEFMGDSEFTEQARNIDPTIPSAADIPAMPDDVRSFEAWDESAQDMLDLKNRLKFAVPTGDALSPEAIEQSFETLKQQAQAYKADDPQ